MVPGWQEGNGLMRINGEDMVVPDGVCGMQFMHIEDWGWYSATGYLGNLPNNGVPIPNDYHFQYTAPYTGCGASSYLFTTPATPGGNVPNNAQRLVVQIPSMLDLKYLDTSLARISHKQSRKRRSAVA
jgi:hypothetical protein